MRRLAGLKARRDFAVLAAAGDAPGGAALVLCNAAGSPVDSRQIAHEARHLAISDTHVIAASERRPGPGGGHC